jgi:hypothetical protein
MKKSNNTTNRILKIKIRRKGIHSKKKNSGLKSSKNYTKRYRGQGK